MSYNCDVNNITVKDLKMHLMGKVMFLIIKIKLYN